MHDQHQPMPPLYHSSLKAIHFWGQSGGLAAFLGALGFAACHWLIFNYAPTESSMGLAQKIFYYHLPFAWWSLVSFFVVFCTSITYLRTKNIFWDRLAGSAAEVGVLCIMLALATGSFWAKAAWGVWWLWDPRLTTTLVTGFIYGGYLIIRQMDLAPHRKASTVAVVGILAFIDVPILYLSASLWRSIHPASVELDPAMKTTLITCVGVFSLFWLGLVLYRHSLALLEDYTNQQASMQLLSESDLET